jgi:hypothetical protein
MYTYSQVVGVVVKVLSPALQSQGRNQQRGMNSGGGPMVGMQACCQGKSGMESGGTE